jgi:hypothetical protein
MHSRILRFVADKELEDVSTGSIEEILTSWDHLPSGIDYVSDMDLSDLDDEIQGFINCFLTPSEVFKDLYTYDKTNHKIVFHEGFKCAYFKPKLKELVKLLQTEDFLTKFSEDWSFVHSLKEAIEASFGTLILAGDYSCDSFDAFVRDYLQYDTVYHITHVADYHF